MATARVWGRHRHRRHTQTRPKPPAPPATVSSPTVHDDDALLASDGHGCNTVVEPDPDAMVPGVLGDPVGKAVMPGRLQPAIRWNRTDEAVPGPAPPPAGERS